MSRSTSACNQQNSTRTLPHQQHVLVVKRHHLLVRWSHWLNVPILLGLLLSGISIYWASPVYQHKPDPTTGNFDVAADIGIWISVRQIDMQKMAASPLQHKVQRAPARGIFFRSGRWLPFSRDWLGDSQAYAASSVGCDLWRV